MKKFRKALAALTTAALVLGMTGMTAFAETSTPSITINPANSGGNTESLKIEYTYYQLLEASIDTDPVVEVDGSTTTKGMAAYYVTTNKRAELISGLKRESGDPLNLFNVTKVDGQDKWYVEASNDALTADEVVTAFSALTEEQKAEFATGTFDKTSQEDSAKSGTVPAGYYYIESSLGTKIAVQTLTAVTINEKNTYPTITKVDDKEYAPIDGTVTYTVEVAIPDTVAAKDIVIHDTITNGLTLNTQVTVSGAVSDPEYISAEFVYDSDIAAVEDDLNTTDVDETVKAASVYKLTIPGDTVLANKGKTLTFTYTAKLNENAVVLEPETNNAHIVYDGFTSVDVGAEVTTLAYDIQKVDGTDKTTVLSDAHFKLYNAATAGNEILVVLKEAASADNGQVNTYRVAKEGETGVEIVCGTARIEGLDAFTYYLGEEKAPTGYNKLPDRTEIAVSAATAPSAAIDAKIENNKGATLPSTGGMGTKIFYALGGILVVGAGILLVSRKRAE